MKLFVSHFWPWWWNNPYKLLVASPLWVKLSGAYIYPQDARFGVGGLGFLYTKFFKVSKAKMINESFWNTSQNWSFIFWTCLCTKQKKWQDQKLKFNFFNPLMTRNNTYQYNIILARQVQHCTTRLFIQNDVKWFTSFRRKPYPS